MTLLRTLALLGGFILLAGCSPSSPTATTPSTPPAKPESTQTFSVRGTVKEIKSSNRVVVTHEEIPGYMEAMTMPFQTRNPEELKNLQPGDAIRFTLVVTSNDSWIEKVAKSTQPPTEMPSRETFRRVRDVEALEIGQLLPDDTFTNQLGRPVKFSDYRGQALALTFIFTRCPIPNYCPRMTTHFFQVQESMKKQKATNWHLFSISFDPERDTPEVLQSYARRFKYDPQHWSFLTGAWIDTTALAEQFGVVFWKSQENLNHNLRTIVVDPTGKIQKIIPDNEWEPADVVAELQKLLPR